MMNAGFHINLKELMSKLKRPVIPTRVGSLVWTKPERNLLDKMWLDSGVGELYLSSYFGSCNNS